jgi:hypothetical protein
MPTGPMAQTRDGHKSMHMLQIYIEKLKSLVRRKGFIISHTFNITKLLSKKKRKAEVHL